MFILIYYTNIKQQFNYRHWSAILSFQILLQSLIFFYLHI